MLESAGGEGRAETLALTGDPAHELVKAAKRTGADVVAVGTRGQGALGRASRDSVDATKRRITGP